MGQLDGKTAIVTGGASGIGEATVRRFTEEGALVTIGDIQDERGQSLARELGSSMRYQRADVSQEETVQRDRGAAGTAGELSPRRDPTSAPTSVCCP